VPLILPNAIANGQNADGNKLDQNFDAVANWANQEAVTRDGSTAMTGPLLLSGPPTQANQAATKSYVDGTVGMTGEVKMWPGLVEPAGYMFCRGQAISRASYNALFAILGTSYGAGDGSSTFNLPDYRGRSPLGVNTGSGYGNAIGAAAGSGSSILPAHTHAGVDHVHLGVTDHAHGGVSDHYHSLSGVRTGDESQPHFHEGAAAGASYAVIGGSIQSGTGPGVIGSAASTNWNKQTHTHLLSGYTGAADRALSTGLADRAMNTGGADRPLTTGSAGTSDPGSSNYHPILTINFIIRVG
jgi:microcystin-dependent protein